MYLLTISAYQMKSAAVFLLIFVLINIVYSNELSQYQDDHPSSGEPSKLNLADKTSEPEENWFEQKLDHFNTNNEYIIWKQRYFMNDKFYRNNSDAPIFLTLGGELAISSRWVEMGAWIRFAEHFGALCFHLEHRFYGKSQPRSDLSYENLKYLSSKQALADVANFIESMNQKYSLNSKQHWIVFGGSYPGALAAWAREKYSHLIHGAISSSAPILAKVDFVEYFQVVKASLATHSVHCVAAFGRAFAEIETLLRHEIDRRDLNQKFNTCTPIEDSIANHLDISNFFQKLADNIAGVIQFNNIKRPDTNYTIDEVCNVMVNTTIGPPVDRLGVVSDILLEKSKEKCLDYKYEKMLSEMKDISWQSEVANGTRQWTYQTCNEFGFYQTSNNRSDTFGDRFKVDFFIKQCMDIYSESMNATHLERVVAETNSQFGGLNPNTTNVLYVHGSIDPWHALGLTSTNNPELPTIFIEGTAHCADMYASAETDPPQLTEARNKIFKYLKQFLGNSNMENS